MSLGWVRQPILLCLLLNCLIDTALVQRTNTVLTIQVKHVCDHPRTLHATTVALTALSRLFAAPLRSVHASITRRSP